MFEVYIKISKDLSRVSEMHHARRPGRAAHGDQRSAATQPASNRDRVSCSLLLSPDGERSSAHNERDI